MVFLYRIILFIVLLPLGIYFIAKSETMVRIFGHNDMAERYLGSGGSYLFWKLLGIVCIILAVLFLTGSLDRVFYGIESNSENQTQQISPSPL